MKQIRKNFQIHFKGGLMYPVHQHDQSGTFSGLCHANGKAAQWGGAVGIRANDRAESRRLKRSGFTSNRALENLAR